MLFLDFILDIFNCSISCFTRFVLSGSSDKNLSVVIRVYDVDIILLCHGKSILIFNTFIHPGVL